MELAGRRVPRTGEVLPALVLRQAEVEGAKETRGRGEERQPRRVQVPEGGLAGRWDDGGVVLRGVRREPGAVGRQRVVVAVRLAVARRSVGVEDVAGPGDRERADLYAVPAGLAVHRAGYRAAGDALAHNREKLREHVADLDGPARHEGPGTGVGRPARVTRRLDRVHARIHEVELPRRVQEGERAGVQA